MRTKYTIFCIVTLIVIALFFIIAQSYDYFYPTKKFYDSNVICSIEQWTPFEEPSIKELPLPMNHTAEILDLLLSSIYKKSNRNHYSGEVTVLIIEIESIKGTERLRYRFYVSDNGEIEISNVWSGKSAFYTLSTKNAYTNNEINFYEKLRSLVYDN